MGPSVYVNGERGTEDFSLRTGEATGEGTRQAVGEWLDAGRSITEIFGETGTQGGMLSGRKAAQEVPTSQLVERMVQHLTRSQIGIDVASVGIDDDDPIRGTGHHAGQCSQTQRRGCRQRR
jgi:hypothetical protein